MLPALRRTSLLRARTLGFRRNKVLKHTREKNWGRWAGKKEENDVWERRSTAMKRESVGWGTTRLDQNLTCIYVRRCDPTEPGRTSIPPRRRLRLGLEVVHWMCLVQVRSLRLWPETTTQEDDEVRRMWQGESHLRVSNA